MRILIASPTFPPAMDGVSHAAFMMATAFTKRKCEVEIVTGASGFQCGVDSLSGLIHKFDVSGTLSPSLPFKGEVEAYKFFLKQDRWDIIFFHSWTWPTQIALKVLPFLRAKSVYVSHGYGDHIWVPTRNFPFGLRHWGHLLYHSIRLVSYFKRFSALVFLSAKANSSSSFDLLVAKIFHNSRIFFIPNGIPRDLPIFLTDTFRQQFSISPSTVVLLCVANYSKRKAQWYAARAFREANIPNSVLVFIGSKFNYWSESFRNCDFLTSKKPGNTSVLWLENIDRNTTLRAIAESDLIILSSNHEAQPIFLLEAMRSRKAWIAREKGSIAELSGGICVRSIEEMAEAMILLSRDSKLRSQMGEAGYKSFSRSYTDVAYEDSYHALALHLISTKNN